MRTTVEINDVLAARVKAVMASRRTTLRALVEEGLRHVVYEQDAGETGYCLEDASAGEGGLVDGVDDLRWETVRPFLYPGP